MGKIELKEIQTPEAEKRFSELLEENKTYFLNGTWGSGKTEFLEKVERASAKKFVYLDLWKIKDERTVVNLAYNKLHPIWYWTSRFLTFLAIVAAVIMTPVINLGLEKIFPQWLKYPAILLAVVVAAWQMLKFKSDAIFGQIIRYHLKAKVLVIDDFDRVNKTKQEEAYKLFNILNASLPIIFVGDFNKIEKNRDDYLQKIIDYRIELPYPLHPRNIWSSYFLLLEESLNFQLSNDFKQIFISENRNLREREHFNNYVNKEFFNRGKLNHVLPEQQLVVIYLYLFEPSLYEKLLVGELWDYSSSYQEYLNKKSEGKYAGYPSKTRNDIIRIILEKEKGYSPFSSNPRNYYLYEVSSNLSTIDAEKILDNDELLKRKISVSYQELDKDFYNYIISNYSNFEEFRKAKLFDFALEESLKRTKNDLVAYIIRERNLEIFPYKTFMPSMSGSGTFAYSHPNEWGGRSEEEVETERFEKWKEILNSYDVSQQIYLLDVNEIFNFYKLAKRLDSLSLDNFEKNRDKDVFLVTYFIQKQIQRKFGDWEEDIWNKIDTLSNEQFLNFWKEQGVITQQQAYDYSDYTIWVRRYDSHDKEWEDMDLALQHIAPRVKKLEELGYNFEYVKEPNEEERLEELMKKRRV